MTELEEPIITAFLHRSFLPAEQRDPKKADEPRSASRSRSRSSTARSPAASISIGPEFTIADLNVASVLSIAPMGGLDLGTDPERRSVARTLHRTTGAGRAPQAQHLGRAIDFSPTAGRFLFDLTPAVR